MIKSRQTTYYEIIKLAPGKERFTERPRERRPFEKPIPVRIRFDRKITRWVRERQHYTFYAEQERHDGVVMQYRVRRLADIMPWTMSWGSGAEVLAPKELREMARDEAKRVANMLT